MKSTGWLSRCENAWRSLRQIDRSTTARVSQEGVSTSAWTWLNCERERNFRLSVSITLAFLTYLCFAHGFHEIWRDEMHPWIVARDAASLWDLVWGDRVYDGHPPGWYFALYFVSRLGRDPLLMQGATIVLGGITAFLIIQFAPFPRWARALMLLSYFVGYEYLVIARNYSLGLAAVVLVCCLFHPLRLRLIGLVIALMTLALSSVYGAILSCCFCLPILAQGWGSIGTIRPSLRWKLALPTLVVILVVGLVAGLSVLSCIPPDANPFAPGWSWNRFDGEGLRFAGARLVYAFFPLRHWNDVAAWQNVATFWLQHPALTSGVAILLVLLMAVSLMPAWPELTAWLMGSLGMAALQTGVYPGSLRHWGHYYLLYWALIWTKKARFPRQSNRIAATLLVLTAPFQVETLFAVAGADFRGSFSSAQSVSESIRAEHLDHLPIVAGPDWLVISLMGYLDKPFYSAETDEINQTQVFHGRRKGPSIGRLMEKAALVAASKGMPVLLVVPRPVPIANYGAYSFQPIFTSETPSVEENLFVYRVMLTR